MRIHRLRLYLCRPIRRALIRDALREVGPEVRDTRANADAVEWLLPKLIRREVFRTYPRRRPARVGCCPVYREAVEVDDDAVVVAVLLQAQALYVDAHAVRTKGPIWARIDAFQTVPFNPGMA